MNTYHILLFLSLAALSACKKANSSNANPPIHEDIFEETAAIRESDIFSECNIYDNNLSNIASEIDFIPLSIEPPLNDFHILDIKLTDDYIFLSEMYKILQYSKQGQYIKDIGSRGMGPKEYVQLSPPLQIDEENKLLYAVDRGRDRVIAYNFDGALHHAFSTHYANSCMSLLDSSIIAFRQSSTDRYSQNHSSFITFISTEGKQIRTYNSYLYPIPFENARFSPESSPLWKHNNKFYYLEYGADTIFQILKDSIIPAKVIKGTLKPKLMELLQEDTGSKLRIVGQILRPDAAIFESDNFIIFKMTNDYESFYLSYHKDAKTYHRTFYNNPPVRKKTGANTGTKIMDFFIDDIVSGISFAPQYQSQDKAMALIPAITVMEQKNEILKFIAANPSKQGTQLKEIIENMTEDDNPIIMTVKFK
ncbi:MAG: 6-bladed beta-propeller [Tannerellaceae bacterium]|nr:6-bladed beta-propeller [Tannerellaceae bacterium]